jgi:hypothetical protein
MRDRSVVRLSVTIDEVILLRVAAEVGERQHHDGVASAIYGALA